MALIAFYIFMKLPKNRMTKFQKKIAEKYNAYDVRTYRFDTDGVKSKAKFLGYQIRIIGSDLNGLYSDKSFNLQAQELVDFVLQNLKETNSIDFDKVEVIAQTKSVFMSPNGSSSKLYEYYLKDSDIME